MKKHGQAALERKGGDEDGKRGVETSDIRRQDWDQQAVQRQMALTEQRERDRIDERRKEYRESGEDEQGIGERIRLTEGMKRDNEGHERRNAIIEENGSCFQLSSKADGDLGERKRRPMQLDHDDEMGPMHGMSGTLDVELEVRRTTKRGESAAFLRVAMKAIGPPADHVEVHWPNVEGRLLVDLDLGRSAQSSSRRHTVGIRARQGASLQEVEAANAALRTCCH